MRLLLARGRTLGGVAAAGAAAVVLAAACGGAPEEEPALLPAALAADLAERSDTVAQTLERGDGCTSARQAKQLRAAVKRALAEGRIPVELRAEMRQRASSLVQSIVCVKPPPPTSPPARDEEDDEDRDEEHDEDEEDEEDTGDGEDD